MWLKRKREWRKRRGSLFFHFPRSKFGLFHSPFEHPYKGRLHFGPSGVSRSNTLLFHPHCAAYCTPSFFKQHIHHLSPLLPRPLVLPTTPDEPSESQRTKNSGSPALIGSTPFKGVINDFIKCTSVQIIHWYEQRGGGVFGTCMQIAFIIMKLFITGNTKRLLPSRRHMARYIAWHSCVKRQWGSSTVGFYKLI